MGSQAETTIRSVARFGGRLLQGVVALMGLLALLVALPGALIHFARWPLPDHIPTGDEIQALLLNPMSARLLVNTLACLCWIVWFFFALDVVRCTVQAARGIPRPSVRIGGPLNGLAAALVGTVVMTLLTRAHDSPTTSPVLSAESVPAVVSAPLHPGQPRPAIMRHGGPVVDVVPPGMVQVTEEVRAPQNGIYDSLWRISERILHDGNRWPELYQLNRGVLQPDGRTLQVPHLVQPGWRIIAHVPAPAPPVDTTAPPDSSVPEAPNTSSPEPDSANQEASGKGAGIDLGNGALVSLALAGTVAAALAAIRVRHRRHYRIGSGDRSDLDRPIAPVVRALRLAHEREDNQHAELEQVEPGAALIGVHNGRDIAIDLASSRGLGLVGPGAAAAARALLLHLVTQRPATVRVLIPAADFGHVFAGTEIDTLPSTVAVVESLDSALDEMETALLTRTRNLVENDHTPHPADGLVLIATPAPHAERRLQAVLDNGSTLGLTAILLGHWRPGATVRVRPDGTVSATSAGVGDTLAATRMFTLPAPQAGELLALLGEAEGSSGVLDDEHEFDIDDAALTSMVSDAVTGSPEPEVARQPLALRVFGTVELTRHDADGSHELRCALTPKQREVLVFLSLHPEGVRREALNEAVWPDSRPPRPFNSMHNALSLLRRSLSRATDGAIVDLILNDDGRYRLNPTLVSTDCGRLHNALQTFRRSGNDAVTGLSQVADLYRADLAEGLSALWVEPFRESIRRDVLDALAVLARTWAADDPEAALALLERSRELDRYNEDVYCDIMRLHARLGRLGAVSRTLGLLTAVLGEIGQRPGGDTINLATSLQRHGNGGLAPLDNVAAG